ncbi:DUF7503 family protein [Haloglomus halophilum]|nr:hypothetical protein [Haloglomus halophilum]
MNSEDGEKTVATYLKEHPRMSGVLFTLLLLLSQSGSAVAQGVTGSGP